MKKNVKYLLLSVALGFGVVTSVNGCGSFDYGNEPPTEILVDVNNPNWNADIRPLMIVKCMNCHADPKPQHAPSSTPKFKFDDENSFATLASSVSRTVFTSKSMPKNYGTPLSDNEKAALKKYLISKGITVKEGGDTKGTDTKTDTGTSSVTLPAAYATNCASCHGDNAKGSAYKDLTGLVTTEAALKTLVRNGKNGMPAFDASKVSDAQITEIYNALKLLK
jgi:cytochrome c553